MTLKLNGLSKSVARVAVVLVFAAGASACSSVPGWVDPTSWFGDDNQAATATPEETAAENGQTPDLANVPNKPAPASTADEQKQVADSLAADKARTQYSGDALRGGTEATAPLPPDAPPADQVADTSAGASTQSGSAPASDQTASTAAPPPATPTAPAPAYFGAPPAPKPAPMRTAQEVSSAPGTLPAVSAETAPASAPTSAPPNPASTADARPAVAPTAVASSSTPAAAPDTKFAMAEPPPATTPVPGALPAVPANGGSNVTLGALAQAGMADNLGFQRSSAPPLDPSVGQFVSQPVLARYEQTASMSGSAGIQAGAIMPTTPTAAVHLKKSRSDVAMTAGDLPSGPGGVGGPEQMSGAVVANFDALQTASVASPAVYADSSGVPPAAVVFFPHDTTILSAEARTQVHAAVQAFQANGGQGFIRVVGHSSSRTSNMTLQRHLIWNFERSQARAKAVARELIREGVPAGKVLVEAVGDSQPVYYESMPQGEEGNRRAEIFLQS